MRRTSIVCFLILGLAELSGCIGTPGQRSAKQVEAAIDQALRGLQSFGMSVTPALQIESAQPAPELVQAENREEGQFKKAREEIKEINRAKSERFQAVLEELETALSKAPPEAARVSKAVALGYGLAAQLRMYQAHLELAQYRLANAAMLTQESEVNRLAADIRGLKSEVGALEQVSLAEPLGEGEKTIADLNVRERATEELIRQVDETAQYLQGQLDENLKRRDALNQNLTDMRSQMSGLAPKEALTAQEKVNEIAKEHFAVSELIDRIKTGPFELPESHQITLDGRKLVVIAGLQQLGQEKDILARRQTNLQEATKAGEDYVHNLGDEAKANSVKAQALSKWAESLSNKLQSQVDELTIGVQKTQTLIGQAQKDAGQAVRHAQSAQNAMRQYLTAIDGAMREVKPGQTDNFLELAKKDEPAAMAFDNIAIKSLLTESEIANSEQNQFQQASPVLMLAADVMTLPEGLARYLEGTKTSSQAGLSKVTDDVEQAIKLGEQMQKSARTDEQKLAASTALAAAYYRASALVPDRSAEFFGEAGNLCRELLAKNPDPNSEAGQAIFQLKGALKIE